MVNVSKSRALFETSFPIYCVRCIGDRHVLVAGGGGQAKTGVPNCIEIYLFDIDNGSWEFRKTDITSTGLEATMNIDILCADPARRLFYIACGQEGNCAIYEANYDLVDSTDGKIIIKDGNNSSKISPSTRNVQKLCLNLNHLVSFQSDFPSMRTKVHPVGATTRSKTAASISPFQKVVKLAHNAEFLATGGSDGYVRLWRIDQVFSKKAPSKILEIKAHNDDVDDLDISPNCQTLVSVSRDCSGSIWSQKSGEQLCDLSSQVHDVLPDKYRYRFARFCPITRSSSKNKDDHEISSLLTICIPIVRTSKQQPCFIARWLILSTSEKSKFKCRLVSNLALKIRNEVASAMSLSGDGRFFALGTLNGSVAIGDCENLQILKFTPNMHEIFITSLDFLPYEARFSPKSPFCPLLYKKNCGVLSVSADNCAHLNLLTENPVGTLSLKSTFLLMTFLWILVYYLMVFLEL